MRYTRGLLIAIFATVGMLAYGAGESPDAFASRLVATFFDSRPSGTVAMMRMGNTDGMVHGLNSLRAALSADQNARIKDERMHWFMRYHPIWKDDKLVRAEWDTRAARIKAVPEAAIQEWQVALNAISNDKVPEIWVIGFLIDAPSAFGSSGFNQQRSTLLRERTQKLPPEAVRRLADKLNLHRAWAAMALVQNDALFENTAVKPALLEAAVAAVETHASVRKGKQ